MKTYKDLYKPPYYVTEYGSHIWDQKGQMVAQFEYRWTREGDFEPKFKKLTEDILEVLNSNQQLDDHTFRKEGIYIYMDNDSEPIITIRGWGRLTGVGGYNLSEEEAVNVQNTFAEFIINRLNNEQKP